MNAKRMTGFLVLLMSVALVLIVTGACSSPKEETAPAKAVETPVPASVAPVEEPVTPAEDAAAEPAEDAATEPEEETVSPATPQKRPYAESPYAENIDAGLVFMADNANDHTLCTWADYPLLDFLQRKFALDEWFTALEAFDVATLHEDEAAFAALHGRMTQPDFRLEDAQIPLDKVSWLADYEAAEDEKFVTAAALRHLPNNMLRIMLCAMFCDVEPLDDAFGAELVETAEKANYAAGPNALGGYLATHMVLAWQWMRELGCAEGMASLEGVDEKFADLLTEIVESQGVVTDLGIEALTVLYYIGAADRVKDEWIEAVAEAQLASGAWDRRDGKGGVEKPNCHTTVLALWALMEHALPDTEDIPWVR